MSTCHVTSREDFQGLVYPSRVPMVLKGVDLGHACSLWQAEYLAEKCGALPVQVHVTPDKKMNFLKRNFVYK